VAHLRRIFIVERSGFLASDLQPPSPSKRNLCSKFAAHSVRLPFAAARGRTTSTLE